MNLLAAFLADEFLDARPWDQLLALGILGAVASVPIAVRWLQARQRERTRRLCAEFGADYDEIVNEYGGAAAAERHLLRRREERRDSDA
ncbi:MAG: hypothetical protein WBO97_12460 [Tepidiformaceae bacterium]